MSKRLNKTSKFLSFVLRHKPEAIGLNLDANGWANIDKLITSANSAEEGMQLDRELIIKVVNDNDKKRFIISDDGQNIRANQGHSIKIDLELKPTKPPETLYHGTASRFLDSILKEGLKPGKRQHVHLSTNIETATQVGQRYGKPVILKVNTLAMCKQGHQFFVSENGVWLTETVPKDYIQDYPQ